MWQFARKVNFRRLSTFTQMSLSSRTVLWILNWLAWMRNPINLFVLEDDEFRGPVMELFVDDLEKARDTLEFNGCKVLRWRGKGKDCYIQDPFGVIFNIWEA
jgi:hypothetical protein